MKHSFQGMVFDAPEDFGLDEAMLTLRSNASDDLASPMLLQKQYPVHANLIVHRRVVHEEATIELLSGEICAELVSSVDGMENLAMEPFPFADGVSGMMIAFDFSIKVGAAVRQYQAMRLDGQLFSTLTLTVDQNKLNETRKAEILTMLGSAAPASSSS